MARWEYLVKDITGEETEKIQELFNSLGLGGWELVAVSESTVEGYEYSQRMAYFKRRRRFGGNNNTYKPEDNIVEENDSDVENEDVVE